MDIEGVPGTFIPKHGRKTGPWRGLATGAVIVAAIAVTGLALVLRSPHAKAATDPPGKARQHHAAAQLTTVTVTGVTAIEVNGSTVTITGAAMRIMPKR